MHAWPAPHSASLEHLVEEWAEQTLPAGFSQKQMSLPGMHAGDGQAGWQGTLGGAQVRHSDPCRCVCELRRKRCVPCGSVQVAHTSRDSKGGTFVAKIQSDMKSCSVG